MNLLDAVRGNDFRSTLRIISRGGAIDIQDESGMTPLHVAVCNDNIQLVRILMRAHPRLETRNLRGQTALLMAAERGNIEIIKTLLRYQASRNQAAELARL
jgi:uncharacterized protein